ncbi:MAG: hypothetical protein M1457_02270, partial [bacterium]|nr:hypothetical protein [bacterium]
MPEAHPIVSQSPLPVLRLAGEGVPRSRTRRERLLDGRLIVETPRGLDSLDRLLIGTAGAFAATRALTVMTPNALPALALRLIRPPADVSYHHIDLYRVRQAQALAARNPPGDVEARCTADLPQLDPPADLMLMPVRRDGEVGLNLELIHQAHATLAPGGHMLAA